MYCAWHSASSSSLTPRAAVWVELAEADEGASVKGSPDKGELAFSLATLPPALVAAAPAIATGMAAVAAIAADALLSSTSCAIVESDAFMRGSGEHWH